MKNLLKITLTLFLATVIVLGFAVPVNMVGNWYQQFMPNIGSRSIQDIFFVDSLTGWAVTNGTNQNPDTIFVLKTTNSGDNWAIHYRKIQTGGGFPGYFKVYFLNQNTGYTCDVKGVDKTTNGGANWFTLNAPPNPYLDMSIKNIDTIWSVSSAALTGGVFMSTNGGTNWTQIFAGGSINPTRIYMYNRNLGFMVWQTNTLYRTTNSGFNWTQIPGVGSFMDIKFVDSLTGWKANGDMKKTTDGGISWLTQTLPSGGIIFSTAAQSLSILSLDTLWSCGGTVSYGTGIVRGTLYKTINGGQNWLFQILDTSYGIAGFYKVQFINQNVGWGFGIKANSSTIFRNVHTTNGGDTTFLVGLHHINSEVPKEYLLYQNYPNPFNPVTNIIYSVKHETENVKLVVFDILGRVISILVNQKQSAGTYETDFNANKYSSGIYFYSLIIDNEVFDTKKMILVK